MAEPLLFDLTDAGLSTALHEGQLMANFTRRQFALIFCHRWNCWAVLPRRLTHGEAVLETFAPCGVAHG